MEFPKIKVCKIVRIFTEIFKTEENETNALLLFNDFFQFTGSTYERPLPLSRKIIAQNAVIFMQMIRNTKGIMCVL